MENEFIKIRKTREFGDVFNDTFAFIKQEAYPLFRAIATIVMPVILITVIVSAYTQTQQSLLYKGIGSVSYIVYAFITFGLLILCQQLLMLLMFGYVKLYIQKGRGNFTTVEIFNEILINFLPTLGATILCGIIIALGVIFCILPGIYLGISLSMFIPVMIFEESDFGSSFSRSFNLTNKQWWWTFLIITVYIILTGTIQAILSLPLFILGFAKIFSKGGPDPEFGLSTFYIVYNAIVSFITIFFSIILHLAITLQYFNIVERFEGETLSDKIDEIVNDEEQPVE